MNIEEPKTVRVKARDVAPHKYYLWCSIENGDPFCNEIVVRRVNDDGTVTFMLDTHNFLKSSNLDEELTLVTKDEAKLWWARKLKKPEPFVPGEGDGVLGT